MKPAMQIHKISIFTLLLGFTFAAHASFPGYGLNRLFTVSEWNDLCEGLGVPRKVAFCKENIHRAVAYGRSLGAFELISPQNQELLQTRSGVFFRNNLNDKIVQVSEDSGMRTTVKLQDDVRCQAYSSAPDLVGVPKAGRGYRHLVKSWLSVYSDATSQIRDIHVGEKGGKDILRFNAVAENKRVIRGTYVVDAQANASIFSTCDYPLNSVEAERNSELFFNAIIGSARRFI